MDEHGLQPKERVHAKKATIDRTAALELARAARTVHVAKGKRLLRFALRDGEPVGDATFDDLERAIIGPSGNLRAPTLFVGKALYVGFLPELYDLLL